MAPPRIRALALCVFHHQGRILVNRFDDPVTGRCLYLRLLGTLESLFVHNDKPGHLAG